MIQCLAPLSRYQLSRGLVKSTQLDRVSALSYVAVNDVAIDYLHCNYTYKLHNARKFICTVVQQGLVLYTL